MDRIKASKIVARMLTGEVINMDLYSTEDIELMSDVLDCYESGDYEIRRKRDD